jgi:uncharacterized membrane protein YdjX (TVP38/TMEM64 family)
MSRRGYAKLALVGAVAVTLAAAYALGVLDRLANPEQLRRSLVELGSLGYLAFVVAYAILQPFGVPGTVFIMAAPLIWPWPEAFALSMVGTMAASVVGFSFARFVARDWVTPRIPERFRRYERALERRGFVTVAGLRFVFWMPPLLHAFFGVSNVGFGAHFWGSLLGYAVPLFLVSFFGQRLFDMMRALPAAAWAVVGVVIVMLVALVVWRARRSALADVPDAGPARE